MEQEKSWIGIPAILVTSKKRRDAIFAIEDTIADIGYLAERNAYLNASSQVSLNEETLSEWGDHDSLTTILRRYAQHLEGYWAPGEGCITLVQAMAVLVHAMDQGLIGMNPVFTRQPNPDYKKFLQQAPELYTEFRAGEQALFLWPLRYKNLLNVMERLEWYGNGYGNSDLAIHDFVCVLQAHPEKYESHLMKPNFKLALKLSKFYQMVNSTGQHFLDWKFLKQLQDIPFAGQCEDMRNETDQTKESDFCYQSKYLEAYESTR